MIPDGLPPAKLARHSRYRGTAQHPHSLKDKYQSTCPPGHSRASSMAQHNPDMDPPDGQGLYEGHAHQIHFSDKKTLSASPPRNQHTWTWAATLPSLVLIIMGIPRSG